MSKEGAGFDMNRRETGEIRSSIGKSRDLTVSVVISLLSMCYRGVFSFDYYHYGAHDTDQKA